MANYQMTDFDRKYQFELQNILTQPVRRNVRTGKKVKEVFGITFLERGMPLLTLRNMRPRFAIVEALWFLSGSKDLDYLHKWHLKAWDAFMEGGELDASSGYRWRHAFGVDQLRYVIDELFEDPSSRQAVMTSWLPSADCKLPSKKAKNVPCLPFWVFTVIDGQRLCLSILQRSADMWYGFPHDICCAAVIQKLVAEHLELKTGDIRWTIANAHLYEDQWGVAEQVVHRAKANMSSSGSRPNNVLTLTRDLLPSAMNGKTWVANDLVMEVESWYDKMALDPIKGPKLAL